MIERIWERIKNTKLIKLCEGFYGGIIHLLFKGKWISKVLAFGGLHLAILFVLGFKACCMWNEINTNNVTSFNQIIYRFYGDTLQNYRMNYLNFEKDMRRRPENTYNENDIVFYYGFIKNEDSVRVPKYIDINYSNLKNKGDLVAKVRYITCNNIPDTLSKRKSTPRYIKVRKQVQKTKYVSNHDRYYYDISTKDDSVHVFKHVTHANDHLIEWDTKKPCFTFWMGFILDDDTDLIPESVIKIKINDFEKDISKEGYRRPLIVDKVLPQPTFISLNEIVYRGEELKAVIKQRGIYISGTDPEKKEIIEKQNLRTTVLMGTIIAFMLDIIVNLILKWRRMREYKNIFSNNSSK